MPTVAEAARTFERFCEEFNVTPFERKLLRVYLIAVRMVKLLDAVR